MRITIKNIMILGLIAALSFTVAGCSQLQKSLDVVGKEAVTSFDEVLKAIPDKVEADEVNNGWSLSALDETVKFIWSKDWSNTPIHDVMFEFDSEPFLEAGLDPEKLPEQFAYYEDMLIVGIKFGDDVLKYSGETTPLTSFEQIVNLKRNSIGYHAQFDHYGVSLGNGNMFEWAKNLSVNDKDIVFVLEPAPLIEAGVNPEAVEGWLYGKVTVDVDGKMTEVDKFLKPFDLQ